MLFTDIVGSTEMAAQLGDRRWRRTVAKHHALIRRELKRHHGREVDTAGDGFFALFESPTDAVRCAAAVLAAVHGIGLRIRAGLHTGEVETAGEKAGGIAVHIGARLLAMAEPEEVLVSSTVRDLVAGSGHEFEYRGEHELKGVPGRWHVHALVLPRLDSTIAVAADEEDRSRTSRRTLVIAIALAAGLALAASAGAVLLVLRPPPPVTGSGALVAYGREGPTALAGWAVGRGPAAVAIEGDTVWVTNIDSGTLARLEPGSGALATLGQVGAHPSAVAVAAGQVWVSDPFSDRVSVLSSSGQLVRQLDVHASALAAGERVMWLADDLRDRIVGLDVQTFAQVTEVELPPPAGPHALAVVEGILWAAAPRSGGLLRIDLASGMVSVVPLGIPAITEIAADGADLWIASRPADLAARLDGNTGRLAARAEVCDAPVAMAPFSGGAWVACATERALWRLDAAGAVAQTIALDGVPTDALVDGERVWVTLRGD